MAAAIARQATADRLARGRLSVRSLCMHPTRDSANSVHKGAEDGRNCWLPGQEASLEGEYPESIPMWSLAISRYDGVGATNRPSCGQAVTVSNPCATWRSDGTSLRARRRS